MTQNTENKPTFLKVIKRGSFGKCPKCGKGKLFKKYLKNADNCNSCGEPLAHIRADDGPAWLTIILLGHIFAVVLAFVPDSDLELWIILLSWSLLGLASTLLILPRAKGFFIGILWKLANDKSKQ